MRLPYFSRSQLGVILLLGAALLLLYAWRAQVFFFFASPPPKPMNLAFVEVTGPVAQTGVYCFPKIPTLGEVWRRAGGPGCAPDRDKDKPIGSGSRVEVMPGGGYRLGAMSGVQLLTLGLLIDLNRATAEDLAAVPGLGPVLANKIVEYRQAHGAFKEIDDLEEVSGISPQRLQKLKPFLGLGGPEANAPPGWEAATATGRPASGPHLESRAGKRPLPGSKIDSRLKTPGGVIDPNLASQKDLEALPGIGPVLAQRIIAYRRAHGPFKKIDDLQKVSGIGSKKVASLKPYLSIHKPSNRD